jgi:D-beta-D-heptose 7-phosphate kinase/D-beta-D-heptose 1-phosphate adenosyltransferase
MDTQQLTPFKILLLGDRCTDEYIIGTCDRLNPEAPVPIMKIVEQYTAAGMAANVYDNLFRLGCDVTIVGNRESIIKTRYIDKRSGQHLLRVDKESEIKPWNRKVPGQWIDYHAVVISDYNKGFIKEEHIEMVIRDSQLPVFVDTKKRDLHKFYGSYLKINESEYNNRWSNSDRMIVTLGGNGAMYLEHEHKKMFSGNPAEVVDVCGCGDTFLAALTYQFLMTNSIDDAIVFANKAASVTVQHRGNYAPSLEEITNA